MKISLVAALLAFSTVFVAAEADGVTLQLDQVKQRYPWNGLVDIDYTITDDGVVDIDDNLEVLMVDKSDSSAVTNRALTFLQAPLPMTAGSHRITWDANADGVTNYTARAEFHIKIVHYSESYMVIDVSGGSTATTYPVDFLIGIPTEGFGTFDYKGPKIVLRRIRPGSYLAGSPANEANRTTVGDETQHRVALSKPFYIGIYEITIGQYARVMGETFADEAAYRRPKTGVSYNTVRGGTWPSTTAPGEGTFMGKLIQKCKSKNPDTGVYEVALTGFDLPTEFQWEYACRAGTTGAFNTQNAYDNTSPSEQEAQLALLGRFEGNKNDGEGGYSGDFTVVGFYEPNAWGLYDMHGNVYEWCRDRYMKAITTLNQFVDPEGPTSGDERVRRGGGVGAACYCRSAYRTMSGSNSASSNLGFRLSFDVR